MPRKTSGLNVDFPSSEMTQGVPADIALRYSFVGKPAQSSDVMKGFAEGESLATKISNLPDYKGMGAMAVEMQKEKFQMGMEGKKEQGRLGLEAQKHKNAMDLARLRITQDPLLKAKVQMYLADSKMLETDPLNQKLIEKVKAEGESVFPTVFQMTYQEGDPVPDPASRMKWLRDTGNYLFPSAVDPSKPTYHEGAGKFVPTKDKPLGDVPKATVTPTPTKKSYDDIYSTASPEIKDRMNKARNAKYTDDQIVEMLYKKQLVR